MFVFAAYMEHSESGLMHLMQQTLLSCSDTAGNKLRFDRLSIL